MSRMIPGEYFDCAGSKAEELIFNTLKNGLGDDWTVFHSYNLCVRNEKGETSDGEIDFLLFNPEKGMLIIEVKGGVIEYRNGEWYQNSQLKGDFLKQAVKNKFAIVNKLIGSLLPGKSDAKINDLPFTIGHALCFPDSFNEMKMTPSGCEGIIIIGNHLPYIKEQVESILKNINRHYKPLESRQAGLILNILMPECKYGSSVCDSIGREERIFFELTEEQSSLLECLDDHKKALIRGCAGSGKTILAIKKARQLASEGNSVLLLCFNSLLAAYIEKEVEDMNGKITALTYHKFCMRELKKLDIKVPGNTSDVNYWHIQVPEVFESHAASIQKYDAIIVDEGQDFMDFYWISIEGLVKEGGHFYIFYDEKQNIFKSDLNIPKLSDPFKLSRNCRNTREIFNKILPHAEGSMKLHDKAPTGRPVTELCGETDRLRFNHLSRILHDLVEKESVKEKDIVILGAHSAEHTCLKDEMKAGMFTISRDGTSGDHQLPYHTYMKFKGCESPVVILLDVCESDPRWQGEGLYTAMSRAKHLLYIIKIK